MKLTSFVLDCKCGHSYCTKHILPEVHNCPKLQEFRDLAKDRNTEKLLRDAMVVQNKIEKIN